MPRLLSMRRYYPLFTALPLVVAALPAALDGQESAEKPAELVLFGGKIVTMDDGRPEATGMAVRGGRIVAVGDDTAMRRWIGSRTRVIELAGKLTIPGFTEGHGHFLGLGQSKMVLNLSGAKNWEEIVKLVAEAARNTPAGNWIVGEGWHQSKWDRAPIPSVEGYPTHENLSRATPNHPVFLGHASGHMCLANAKAMELAGVDKNTPNPPSGMILRDKAGNPIGVFRESAARLISQARSRSESNRTTQEIDRDRDEAIRLATAECLANGVTTFHDAGEPPAVIDHLRRLAEAGRLEVRLWVMVGGLDSASVEQLPHDRMIGAGDNHLTVRAIKLFADGALGTHGAWLLEPYDDLPDSVGLGATPLDEIRRMARLAIQRDFQLCVHAIGDRANREVLDIFAEVLAEHPEKTDVRWRIEHAQHLSRDDIARFARLGVIAAMQGCHCTSDAPFVVQRLGARRAQQGAYAWRSLLDSGATIINGTDVPVEEVNPIRCFYASVTRRLPNGSAFFPEQCMTRKEALRSYTLSPAYAAFEDDLKGSLTPGKLADITVLSKDILTVPEEDICQAKVVYTIVGGKVLFER